MARNKKTGKIEYYTSGFGVSNIPLPTIANLHIIGIIQFVKFFITSYEFRACLRYKTQSLWTRFKNLLQRPALRDIESFESESLTENIAQQCGMPYDIRLASSDSLFAGEKWILSIWCKKHEVGKYYELVNKYYKTIVLKSTGKTEPMLKDKSIDAMLLGLIDKIRFFTVVCNNCKWKGEAIELIPLTLDGWVCHDRFACPDCEREIILQVGVKQSEHE